MATSDEKDLWTLFLGQARNVLDGVADMRASTDNIGEAQLTLLSEHLSVLVSAAWMVGADSVAEAVDAVRRGVRSRPRLSENESKDLRNALDKLAFAFELLSAPAPEEQALAKLLDEIRQFAPPAEVPDSKKNRPMEAAADFEGTWSPQVDPDLLPPFVEECGERLQGLTGKLLTLEQGPAEPALVADIFRDLHTVKGSSAFVGLKPLNRLSHAAEDLVGKVREGALQAGSDVVDVLLSATDVMNLVLQKAVAGESLKDLGVDQVLTALGTPGTRVDLPAPVVPAESPAPSAPKRMAGSGVGGDGQTLRVDFSKLDVLLNLVGELVLDKASFRSVLEGLESTIRALDTQSRRLRRNLWGKPADHLFDPGQRVRPDLMARELNEEVGRVERVLRELAQELDLSVGGLDFVSGQLRDQVMKLRMVPIASVFAKHRRNVRDLSRSQGKKVRLELEGQNTELDKMLVEHLDEPLLHLVRNAIDHGIEPPDVRKRNGKPEEARLRLKAEQRGSQFVVEISDDGRGIDVEKLRRKAVDKKLVTPQRATELSDRECMDLIFSPGFSTARTVTDLSGRGVGLDVVKEVIARLRGTVEVDTTPGHRTTFTLVLPLTLAIRQVLLLRVSGELTALPIDYLKRSMEVPADRVHRVMDRDVLELNDQHLPLIWLQHVLGLGSPQSSRKTIHVVQVKVMGRRYGLVCDGLEGKREIVIKSLGDLITRAPCVAGATLVGERVVLILDVPDLVRSWVRGTHRPAPAAADVEPRPLTRTVLLAEDSPPMRKALKQQFQQLGFEVLEARDGNEALELARSGRFDLVSTDAMMPNVDGYELTRALRLDPNHREVPIVMISVKGERIDKVRGFDAGVDAYLVKPADPAELEATVRRLLGSANDSEAK